MIFVVQQALIIIELKSHLPFFVLKNTHSHPSPTKCFVHYLTIFIVAESRGFVYFIANLFATHKTHRQLQKDLNYGTCIVLVLYLHRAGLKQNLSVLNSRRLLQSNGCCRFPAYFCSNIHLSLNLYGALVLPLGQATCTSL